MEAVVQEQRDLLEKTGFMDSVLVKVNQNGDKVKTPQYMGQSTLDFDCIIKATTNDYDPLLEFKSCQQNKHVLTFKLVEGFVQELIFNKDGDDEVKPQIRTN